MKFGTSIFVKLDDYYIFFGKSKKSVVPKIDRFNASGVFMMRRTRCKNLRHSIKKYLFISLVHNFI